MKALLVCGALLLATACKDRQACERSRLELAKTWEGIKSSAAQLKYAREDIAETMSPSEKEARLKRWGELEEHAALLESAFISRQVTWTSAEKHLGELSKEYSEAPSQDAVAQGFGRTLEQAQSAFQSFKARCR